MRAGGIDLADASVAQLHRALAGGTVTAAAVTAAAIERIRALDGPLHAFCAVDEAAALRAARQADREIRACGARSPLHGIPFAVKDVIDVAGLATSCNSFARAGHRALRDATAVARLRAAGAVPLGKTVTHEFALGDVNHDGPFPAARNPWNPAHVTGGSSSGSAAAVAARHVRIALGTCTGGSIRIPAAWCGAVGLKPTFARVSRHGIFPLAPTLDHCGVLARSVEDAALALQAIAGHDPLDPASATRPVPDCLRALHDGAHGLTLGWPEALIARLRPGASTRHGLDRLRQRLQDRGVRVVAVEFADERLHAACGRVILAAEAYAGHRALMGRQSARYGRAALARLAGGAAVRAADYLDALRLRRRLGESVDRSLDACDALVLPITLEAAPRHGAETRPDRLPALTYVGNVTGHPAVSLPIGLDAHTGLPLAAQLVARRFDEALLLRMAAAVESITGWSGVPAPPLGAAAA